MDMPPVPEQRILVTGGAGFIGSHVCDALLAAGYRVRSMDSYITGKRANIAHLLAHERFEAVEGDIRSQADAVAALRDATAVVHLAALGSVPRSIADPVTTHEVNLGGFLNMLLAARAAGVQRLVFASSSSVYGDAPELPKREDRIGTPLSPYAVSKYGNEVYAGLYHRLHGMRTIGLRFFNVFGERQDPEGPYAAAIPRFIRALLAHEPPIIYGDGHQSRDFTYVGNAVQAVLAALQTDDERAFGEVFNVAYGERTTLLTLLAALKEELMKVDPVVAVVAAEHAEPRVGDVRDSLADIGKARTVLGFAPKVDLREGLARAVPWYVAHWG
jgi:UDP-N-acetylglucosamine 4-epimerase